MVRPIFLTNIKNSGSKAFNQMLWDKLPKLWEQNLSLQALAVRFGVSVHTVRLYAKKLGLPKRDKKDISYE